MADDFKKPVTLGVNLENGYFSEDGQSGCGISSYAGRLNLKFWKKGEKSSDNRDNTVSLNINQAMLLNNALAYIIKSRQASLESGANYADITNLSMTLDGVVNGQPMVFGILRFDTVEIDGINRIKLTVTRNTTSNSIVFCDRFLKSALAVDSPFRTRYDVMDSSFLRFCMDINGYCNFAWSQGAFNKIYAAITGGSRPAGGNGGGHSGGYNGGKSAPRYESNSNPVFDDGEEF